LSQFHGVNKHNRQILEKLSREGSAGVTPAVLGIHATLLERLVFMGLVERLPPRAPGASYRYRISDKGTRFPHAPIREIPMFSILDKDIAAIQAAFECGGELSAAIEVRRIFPGIPDYAEARRIALIVAGWRSMSETRPIS
jgi:hypothetical protein